MALPLAHEHRIAGFNPPKGLCRGTTIIGAGREAAHISDRPSVARQRANSLRRSLVAVAAVSSRAARPHFLFRLFLGRLSPALLRFLDCDFFAGDWIARARVSFALGALSRSARRFSELACPSARGRSTAAFGWPCLARRREFPASAERGRWCANVGGTITFPNRPTCSSIFPASLPAARARAAARARQQPRRQRARPRFPPPLSLVNEGSLEPPGPGAPCTSSTRNMYGPKRSRAPCCTGSH